MLLTLGPLRRSFCVLPLVHCPLEEPAALFPHRCAEPSAWPSPGSYRLSQRYRPRLHARCPTIQQPSLSFSIPPCLKEPDCHEDDEENVMDRNLSAGRILR